MVRQPKNTTSAVFLPELEMEMVTIFVLGTHVMAQISSIRFNLPEDVNFVGVI